MTDPLDPAPAPDTPRALATADPAALPAKRDAHGFDPNDYDWLPVPRQRRRVNGWSTTLQRRFIEALADGGSVSAAAREVGMTVQSCYALRRARDAAGFARAWDAAIEQAGKALLDLAFERVINGEDIPIVNHEGQRIGGKRRYSERLTMYLLSGFFPDRFGRGRAGTAPGPGGRTVTQQPAIPPVEAALAALEPVTPADPHLLMPPAELADFIAAEALDAAEDERLSRDHPELAAREDAGLPPAPPAAMAPRAEPEPATDWFEEKLAAIIAADAEEKRIPPPARRRKERASP